MAGVINPKSKSSRGTRETRSRLTAGPVRGETAGLSPVLEASSTLTERYQTTVPEPVRQALNLSKGDKILYSILANGSVVLTRVPDEDRDPVIEAFLDFLAHDMKASPASIRPITADTVQRLQSLVAGVQVDLNESLEDDE